MTFILHKAGSCVWRTPKRCYALSTQTIPACNRAVPHRVWSLPTKAAQTGGISHVPDHC